MSEGKPIFQKIDGPFLCGLFGPKNKEFNQLFFFRYGLGIRVRLPFSIHPARPPTFDSEHSVRKGVL